MKSAKSEGAGTGGVQKSLKKDADADDDADMFVEGSAHRRPSPTEIVLSTAFHGTPVEQELIASRSSFRLCPEMKLHALLPGDVAVVFLSRAEVAALSLKPEQDVFNQHGSNSGGLAPQKDDKQRSLRAWFGKKSKLSTGEVKGAREAAAAGEKECNDRWPELLQKLDDLAG